MMAFMAVGARQEWFSMPSFFLEIIIFLTLSTLLLCWVISLKLKQHPEGFVKVYLGATVFRIIGFGGFIFLIIILDRSGARQNVVLFLGSYFLFTALEVAILLQQINSQKGAKGSQKYS